MLQLLLLTCGIKPNAQTAISLLTPQSIARHFTLIVRRN